MIKHGRASDAISICYKINGKKIPRHLITEYAEIARRIGKPQLIIQWLGPIIRNKKLNQTLPTNYEKSLYALGLFRLGAFNEAQKLLNDIPMNLEPKALFFQASLLINQWRYKEAIPYLKAYINSNQIPFYQKLIARLNLCAALHFTLNFKKTKTELQSLILEVEKTDFQLIKGNLLEINGQYWIEQKEFQKASECIEQSISLLSKADDKSKLHSLKWKSILLLEKNPNNIIAQNNLTNIQKSMKNISDWESVRSIDLKLALITNNVDLLDRVFWGTRFKQYKLNGYKYIEKKRSIINNNQYMKEFKITNKIFLWEHPFKFNSNQEHKKSNPTIDLIVSAPTLLLKKLFFILSSEFYRPLRVTEISDELYPNEIYNLYSTPIKIHQIIKRARQWLKENKLPVYIRLINNGYKLDFRRPCNLVLYSELNNFILNKKLIEDLENLPREFTVKDFANNKKIPIRTARFRISKMLNKKLIIKLKNKKIPTFFLHYH